MSPSDRPEAGGFETAQGRAMFQELLWVHSAIRRDLKLVEQLAAEVDEGLPGEAVREALDDLKASGPLWQLKVNCLRYCRFVHAHHGAEDRLLFPALRAADASISPIVDRLEADHVRVSDLLDTVEAAARALTEPDGVAARQRVIDGLRELHGHLLEHLDYEELQRRPDAAPPREPRGAACLRWGRRSRSRGVALGHARRLATCQQVT